MNKNTNVKTESNQNELEGQEKIAEDIDYKNIVYLRRFLTSAGRVFSRKFTGLCSKSQRKVAKAIKQAKFLGLFPYCDRHKK
jgi:small subunit ribosomal protein S18